MSDKEQYKQAGSTVCIEIIEKIAKVSMETT